MDKIGRPRGLIRYSSEAAMAEGRTRLLRARVVVYPVLLAGALALFGYTWAGRDAADVTFLRNRANPYRLLDSGEVSSVVLVKVANRTREERSFDVAIPESSRLESADLPLVVPAGKSATASIHVVLPRAAFTRGRAEIRVRVTDGAGFDRTFAHHLLGPLYSGAAS
jgi:polyferredoxin